MSFSDAFTVGTDVRLDIYDPATQSTIAIPGITSFEATPITGDMEHHGLDGDDRFAYTYRGWNITFEYDRLDGTLDRYFAEREARYRSGGSMRSLSVTQTILERDGSVNQYRFSKLDIRQSNAGRYNRDDKVTGTIEGRAGLREKIA